MHHVAERLRPPKHPVLSNGFALPQVLVADPFAERKSFDKRIVFMHPRLSVLTSSPSPFRRFEHDGARDAGFPCGSFNIVYVVGETNNIGRVAGNSQLPPAR